MKKSEVFTTIKQRIADEHLKHVQPLIGRYKEEYLAIKFVSCDTPKYKEKIKSLCKDYSEHISLANESKTTLTYVYSS